MKSMFKMLALAAAVTLTGNVFAIEKYSYTVYEGETYWADHTHNGKAVMPKLVSIKGDETAAKLTMFSKVNSSGKYCKTLFKKAGTVTHKFRCSKGHEWSFTYKIKEPTAVFPLDKGEWKKKGVNTCTVYAYKSSKVAKYRLRYYPARDGDYSRYGYEKGLYKRSSAVGSWQKDPTWKKVKLQKNRTNYFWIECKQKSDGKVKHNVDRYLWIIDND